MPAGHVADRLQRPPPGGLHQMHPGTHTFFKIICFYFVLSDTYKLFYHSFKKKQAGDKQTEMKTLNGLSLFLLIQYYLFALFYYFSILLLNLYESIVRNLASKVIKKVHKENIERAKRR